MTHYKLANILLRLDDHLRFFPQMLYRANGVVDYSESDGSLAFEGLLDFMTYFNAFSVAKWRKYTGIDNADLNLELVGDPCDITLTYIGKDVLSVKDAPSILDASSSSLIKAEVVSKALCEPVHFGGSADYEHVAVDVPMNGDALLIGFELKTQGCTAIRDAHWDTDVPADRIRDVRIAIATTTFKNEKYILPNIDMVRKEVLGADDPIADNLHMFVVDNGRTLDFEGISDEHVTVIPNANEGGSAGFARGMMAALESDMDFTHVLLMDDDVRVSPESLLRTFHLLSLTNDEYAGAFINGAMLEMDRPNLQFEDVSYVGSDGAYRRLKGHLFMDTLTDVSMNELIDVEVPNAYGAWWYSCVPVSAIREHGLPLPFFVRCDDVEFGIRTQPTYMTMNGICVWHAAFTQKFRAAVDSYQYIRNYMIMEALHGISNQSLFLVRTGRTLNLYLRSMAYETAELIVAALEDYMKGPEWLMSSSGEEILKANNARSEKLIPLSDALEEAASAHPDLADAIRGFEPDRHLVRDDHAAGPLLRVWRSIPYDRHLLPDRLIKDEAATAYYGGFTVLSSDQVAKRVLVACDRDCENAHARVMDRKRWRDIRNRWHKARAEFNRRGAEVAQAYRDALPQMTGARFWEEHLTAMSAGRESVSSMDKEKQ